MSALILSMLSTFALIKYTTTVPIRVLYLPGGYSLIDRGIAVQQMYIYLDGLLYPDDDVGHLVYILLV